MPYDWLTGKVGPTGMTVPTDPAATAGLGHPSFLNSLYPKSGIDYHTYVPAKGGWTLPKGTTLGFTKGQGYYARPGAAATGAASSGPASIDALIKQLYGSIETPAQQQARVQKEIDAQIAAQKKLLDDEYQRQMANARAMAAGQEAAGAAAAAMNKDLFASVGGEFNAAAGEIKGLAHGLSKGVQGATAKDVGGANAFLAATGNAPIAESGTFSIGGGKQQGVEEYRGGTLPGQMFGTQGEAANFGLAGMISSQAMKGHEEAQAALITTTREINDSQSKAIQALAAGRGDLYHTYMNDAKDSQIKYISLVQGLISAKQSAAASGVKATLDLAKFKLSVKSLEARIKNQSFQQTMSQIREGRLKGTAEFNQKATIKRLENTAIQNAIANGQVNIPLSKSLKHLVDKAGNPILDSDGNQISSARLTAGTTKKGPTAAVMSKAQDAIERWFYGTKILKGSTTPQAANRVPGFNASDPTTWGGAETRISYVEALKRLTRMKIPRQQAMNMLNEYWERGQGGGVGGRGGRPILSQVERRAAVKKYGLHRLDRILMTVRSLLDAEDDPNDEKYNQAQLILSHLLAGAPIAIK